MVMAKCQSLYVLILVPGTAGSTAQTQGPVTGLLQREALRGLAACELKTGNTAGALRTYKRLLGIGQPPEAAPNPLAAFEHLLGTSASRGQPSPDQAKAVKAQHWAHGEYGWALFQAGRLQVLSGCLPCSVSPACAATSRMLFTY